MPFTELQTVDRSAPAFSINTCALDSRTTMLIRRRLKAVYYYYTGRHCQRVFIHVRTKFKYATETTTQSVSDTQDANDVSVILLTKQTCLLSVVIISVAIGDERSVRATGTGQRRRRSGPEFCTGEVMGTNPRYPAGFPRVWR